MTSVSGAPPAVHATGLRRTFGETVAVEALDLDIGAGSVFGLLGPDGAGKSTLIRMLATVLAPDAGDATVFGHSVVRERGRVTPRIGYMSQRFSMYPDLSVAENLDFFATIRGVGRADRRTRAKALLEGMGLGEFTGRQAQFLSGGMKQKLMLATTLMHEPDLLLLDEPTTGVDPVSRREFWRILAGLHRDGRTVLVATPYMDEAEQCTDIAFLDRGRVRQAGTPEEIKARVPGRLLEVSSVRPREALSILAGTQGVRSAHLLGDVVRVLWDAPDEPQPALAAHLSAAGVADAAVRETSPDMETVFAYLAEASSHDPGPDPRHPGPDPGSPDGAPS
jgi:ABC-2 type transport system ATP-binding protein